MLDLKLLINCQQRLEQINSTKQIGKILMVLDYLMVYISIRCIWVSISCWLQKRIELLTGKDLFKTPTKQEKCSMRERVKSDKEQYKKAKAGGYKGSYTSCVKKLVGLKNHLLHFQDLVAQ